MPGDLAKSILTTDLGLAGLALSGMLLLIISRDILQSRRERTMRQDHKEERDSWREQSKNENELNRAVIEKLEGTIREVLNK